MLKATLDTITQLKAGDKLTLSGWIGASKAYLLGALVRRQNQNVVLVCSDTKRATKLKDDLDFFLPATHPTRLFNAVDVSPYYNLSPNPDLILDRLAELFALSYQKQPYTLIVPLKSLSRRLMPRQLFLDLTLSLTKEQDIVREDLINHLTKLGYQRVPLVEDKGTFAVRGSIIDIYSPAYPDPIRLDFFDEFIESIRFFDPVKQKTKQDITTVHLIPAREILFNQKTTTLKSQLKKRCDDLEISKAERDQVSEAITNGIYFNGIESYTSLFYDQPNSLFDYLPDNTLLIFDDENSLKIEQQNFFKELENHQTSATSVERIFNPEEIFLTPNEISDATAFYASLNFNNLAKETDQALKVDLHSNEFLKHKVQFKSQSEKSLKPLAQELADKKLEQTSIAIVAGSLAQKERIADILSRYDLDITNLSSKNDISTFINQTYDKDKPTSSIALMASTLSSGFYWPHEHLWWITDQEIFGKKTRKAPKRSMGEVFSSFAQLHPDDFVVHEQHGVGIYKSLVNLTINNISNDFLHLEYLGGDKLYVPVDQLNKIYRYSAQEGAHPMLDKMGGATWSKVREKVKRATRKLAKELLKIQAARASQVGFAFSPINENFEEFEASFDFEETNDQLTAIEDVVGDMQQNRPMDRLVCGDVGYGKTEVAMRAAFKAVLDKKQVLVLVPTTVLAFQHFETFKKRFDQHAVTIELMSRFQNAKEQKQIAEKLKAGQVDIVIGTHRLLSADIKPADLGLLIIDEEHRFGVGQKEKIKKLKNLVDVLTLSATPIPRTLNFAMVGIRDLSLINTPPADRLAIRTYVSHFDEATLKEAITREIKRGGQVFFVHNRVQSIQAMKDRLQKIVPDLKIAVGHGQMKEEELESVMIDFMDKKFDILICTTIIESGLDIPSANTMIINRADHMGLAQLYQLRGRVGRSHHRAYCYLLIPHDSLITDVAKKRLSVIQRFTELGSGFKIASHDLEIRGAGNILGPEQSGHIASVGYDLYVQLLEEAVALLRGDEIEEKVDSEIKFPISASIPHDLIPDTSLRLSLYKQISSVTNEEDVFNLLEEFKDRFGELPQSVTNLIHLMHVKVLARQRKILSLTGTPSGFVLHIHPASPISSDWMVTKIQSQPQMYRLTQDNKLFVAIKNHSDESYATNAITLLKEMKTAG